MAGGLLDVQLVATHSPGTRYNPKSRNKQYAIELTGQGHEPVLGVEFPVMDFGPVVANSEEKCHATVKVFNHSNQEVYFRITKDFVWGKLDPELSPMRKDRSQR